MTLFYVTCTFFTFLLLCMRSVMLQINEYDDMMMMLVLPCSNRVKAYQPYYSNRVFIISQSKYSTSTKSPLQAKNSTFLWQGHGQRIHQNSPKRAIFKFRKSFVLGRRHSPLFRPLPR